MYVIAGEGREESKKKNNKSSAILRRNSDSPLLAVSCFFNNSHRLTSYEMSGGTRYNSRSDHDPGNKNGKSHKKQGI